MITVLENSNLSLEERIVFFSIQGLVNRSHANLYLDIDNYLNYIKDEQFTYESLSNILKKNKGTYKGAVVFTYETGNINLNIASSLSGILDYLMIPKNIIHFVDELKIENIIDLDDLTGDYIDKQEIIFEQYKHMFHKDGLIHQVCLKDNYHITLRDYGISQKWFCFYTGEDEKSKSFRNKVLTWANKNIAIFGWTSNEIDFVDDISKYGDYIIPSDWSCNHSFLDKHQEISIKQNNVFNNISLDDDESHYLTIVVSDGDNVQWLERDFSTTSSFGQRLKTNQEYIMGFTIAPSMVRSCPKVIKHLYGLGKNNYFVSGVSGAGYMNPCAFPPKELPIFCKETGILMKKCDLEVVTLLDNLKNKDKMQQAINCYANQGNIIGGIYELDPSKYAGGKGDIYFSDNGKPFASVRITFWAPDGTHNSVTKEWIDSIADEINSFKIDKHSKEGYTVLNVHPWSTSISDLDYLISKLDKHIKIIKPNDFLTLIKKNLK